MPAYKDQEKGTWYAQFYYETWTGERKKKFKRGFATKREAAAWEREFLDKQQANPDMLFSSLVDLYLEDMSSRLRQSTMRTKKLVVNDKILPYFKDLPISSIKPTHIRKWQNELMDEKYNYKDTYLRTINGILVAIFSYAVKYYNLKENPCTKAGSIGKKYAGDMKFWTLEEFNEFIPYIADNPTSKAAFETLYWTGMRLGELLALTPNDIDLDNKEITISKSYQRIYKKDVITEPKTAKSNRVIAITDTLCETLEHYMNSIYGLQPTSRIFIFYTSFLSVEMKRGEEKSGLKKIRVHDLRHSHASLLIELDFSPLLIAERLGHERVETTLNIYSHLYPNKQIELITKLQELQNSSKNDDPQT